MNFQKFETTLYKFLDSCSDRDWELTKAVTTYIFYNLAHISSKKGEALIQVYDGPSHPCKLSNSGIRVNGCLCNSSYGFNPYQVGFSLDGERYAFTFFRKRDAEEAQRLHAVLQKKIFELQAAEK